MSTAATTTLPLFWDLSSASKKERLNASVKLIGALEQFQAQFVPKDSRSDDEDEEDEAQADPIDVLNAQDVSYSIRRLIRGLASPRESSRLGFAVALTELLSRLDTVTCSQILALLLDSTKSQGSMTGQEERDVLFARLFGLTAIVQSGLIVRKTPLRFSASSETSASSLASFQDAIKHLLELGEAKSWLRESAWWSLCLAIDALATSEVLWKESAFDYIVELVFNEKTVWSPEKVAITLKLQSIHPNRDWQKLLCPAFKTPDLLSNSSLPVLGRLLKESAAETDAENGLPKSAPGSWKPQLHFVWNVILDQLLPGPNSSVITKGSFQEFFRVVVDESLFSATSSQERKYSGFQVFQKALPRVTENNVPMLFTKNFMRSWINHLSHPDRHLHKVAKQVATDIRVFVQNQPQLGLALILQLTGVNGSQQFDKLTNSKTVESIVASMNADGIKSYVNHLLAEVNPPSEENQQDIQTINSRRTWIIDQLYSLIHNSAIPKDDAWTMVILDWLALNGLFLLKKKSEKSPFIGLHRLPSPPFSDSLRQHCRDRLLSSLAYLNSQTRSLKLDEGQTIKYAGVASDGEFWVSKVIGDIEKLKEDSKRVALLVDVDEEDVALHAKVRDTVQQLKTVSGQQQEAAKGAELLLLSLLLQHYMDEQPDVDTSTLEDCLDASTRMLLPKKSKNKKAKTTADDTDSSLEPIDIIVDTVIGFLEKSTAFLRGVGNQVFSLLSSSIQGSTIDLILSQLERRNPDELAHDSEDEDEDEDEGMGEEENSDSDTEIEIDEDESEGEVDLELRRKIEEAVRVNGVDAGSADSDGDSDEELMDDEQMLAIDEQLAQVFKMREGEKKGKNVDAQREATHFKNRVLDLVDSFLKKESTNPLAIQLLMPLVELSIATSPDERHLSDKAKGILRSRIAKSKDIPSGINPEEAKTAMRELHSRARKLNSADSLGVLNQCSLYLSKVLIEAGSEDSVVSAYRESLEDFTTRKNCALNHAFFVDAARRYPQTMWSMRKDIFSLSSKAINGYRRFQSLQLLQTLLTHLPSIENKKETWDLMLSFRKALAQTVTDACEGKVAFTPQQMKELLKLASFAMRQTSRIAPEVETPKIWDPAVWKLLSQKLANSERFKGAPGLQKTCEQLSTLPVKSGVSKRKAEADGGEGTVNAPKPKRKKVKD